jgi:hypothetical protein
MNIKLIPGDLINCHFTDFGKSNGSRISLILFRDNNKVVCRVNDKDAIFL